MADFVHLHNHTDFSLQDAAQSVQMMCDRVDDMGMDTVAVTEHGNLFSMIPFYKTAQKSGINAILGCEIYVSSGKHNERSIGKGGNAWGYHHLVLLCMNEAGYKNLMKLVSIGYLDGFYYKPRVDKDLLKEFNEGLIATSACLAGEVTRFAARGDYENCKKAAIEYSEIFPERFYIEMQNHNIPEEIASHGILKKVAKELNIPLVATNDNHYCLEEHWEAHDVLFCLGTGKDRSDPNRHRYEPRQFYIKSADEMYNLFRDTPEALENTLRIAEQCKVDIPMGTYHLPNFPIPKESGTTSGDDYLRMICDAGARQRYPIITPEIQQRLDFELSVIKKMGFAGYFLITQDFVKYAKDSKIPVGPGRGSAAGSIVAYCTGITNVDPIKYNLLFERFLNPDRVTMPDIDIDFCVEGRENVINYIKDVYGHESVAQIITFGTMKAKSSLRDVGRVLGMSYGDVDRIAKMVPDEIGISLKEAEKKNPELAKITKIDDTHKELLDYSKVLEGMHRHASTHAAGVVISPGPLTDYVPLYKHPSTGDIATQVEMTGLEDLGLLKLDFLGLRNLTVIDKACEMIKENHKKDIDIEKIDLNSSEVFSLFSAGKTVGIFQFESSGMQEYLRQLKPTCIQDLIAMNALYRPGPMANIPEFILRKRGDSRVDFMHPKLESILKETYGIIVYQEQVMQIGQEIGGFTLAQGDMMRRAMGKKKASLMATFKIDFVEGAERQNIDKKIAIEIFELLEKFAQYGFNKSHSTAYALVAYQTAWLKVFYPAEFMSANMTSVIDKTDDVVKLIHEAKTMKINIIPPNVNSSFAEFKTTEKGQIAYGLSAVKNIGTKAAEYIARHREKKGKYKSIFDLCKIEGNINRKVLESLIQVGACDNLEGHRSEQLASIDIAIKYGNKFQEEKKSSQESLFGGGASEDQLPIPNLVESNKWSSEECLSREKELIGFYLSGDPLEKYYEDLKEFNNINLLNIPKKLPDKIKIGGIITNINQRFDKKNRPWAIISLDGLQGKSEIFLFNEAFEKCRGNLKVDSAVFVVGVPSNRQDDSDILKFIGKDLFPLDQVRKKMSRTLNIRLAYSFKDKSLINTLKEEAENHKGNCYLAIHLISKNGTTQCIRSNRTRVTAAADYIQKLRNLLGESNVWITS